MNRNSLPYTIIFSFVITFILVLPLTVANDLTKPLVEKNKALASARGVLDALDIPLDGLDEEQIIARFGKLEVFTIDQSGKARSISTLELETAEKSGNPVFPQYFKADVHGETRYAGKFTGPGLWGSITIAIGFSKDIGRFTGLKILDQAETPGLGARISETWFTEQFRGQAIPRDGELVFKAGDGRGDMDRENGSVDGVTGATITVDGVRNIVQKAVLEMKTISGGGNQ